MPLEVHSASHTNVLDKIIASGAGLGSLKLSSPEKNLVHLFLSMEVPDAGEVNGWIR